MSLKTSTSFRVIHRYLGFFLSGIMAVYALSGIALIFRDTNFLKKEKTVEKKMATTISTANIGKELKIRDFKIASEDSLTVNFKEGSFNKKTGVATYKVKELPLLIQKLTHLHKASTKEPLFFLNIFFALSLLFFVVSSFWMFMPKTAIFRKGLYFTLAGIILTLILLFI